MNTTHYPAAAMGGCACAKWFRNADACDATLTVSATRSVTIALVGYTRSIWLLTTKKYILNQKMVAASMTNRCHTTWNTGRTSPNKKNNTPDKYTPTDSKVNVSCSLLISTDKCGHTNTKPPPIVINSSSSTIVVIGWFRSEHAGGL